MILLFAQAGLELGSLKNAQQVPMVAGLSPKSLCNIETKRKNHIYGLRNNVIFKPKLMKNKTKVRPLNGKKRLLEDCNN